MWHVRPASLPLLAGLLLAAPAAAQVPSSGAAPAAGQPGATPRSVVVTPGSDDRDDSLRAALAAATTAYVDAFNGRRFEALADQWTEGAELVEGGGRVLGRERIVDSLRAWLEADAHRRAR